MAKGYWIGDIEVTDWQGMKDYREANREVMNRYGAKFIVMHGEQRVTEGSRLGAHTVVEFPSYADAVACYDDPDYQSAVKLRHAAAIGTMAIVTGYDGPQDI